ncbi:Cysteine--tRNA ligase [Cucumispora dikerogammari]|nr:Cysteine--tRNA ligase [Cucumispora dikerogammari]
MSDQNLASDLKNLNFSNATISIYNSITKQNEQLNIINNQLLWYVCGPTVYDSSHIGHARTYILFDTIRRILEDYFQIEVQYVMNITDIDDKIIIRANENLKLNTTSASLDVECKRITEKFEKEFFEDLSQLNIKKPTFTTRVSNYIPQIIIFIEKILAENKAYISNGSVYFDMKKYLETNTFIFTKPNAVTLSEDDDAEKRCSLDFALWKSTENKENELKYPSIWGVGRPGWHIECSAMANDIFPSGMDIHSGGIDLKFPHHENEIIQAESILKKPWVKYFIHSGHLEVEGQKMSKSLKNFMKISEILKIYDSRSIRLMFLLTKYGDTMKYEQKCAEYATVLANKLFNFISKVESLESNFTFMTQTDRDLKLIIEECKLEVNLALRDNFNIPKAISLLENLIGTCNTKFETVSSETLSMASQFIKRILNVFGLEMKQETKDDDNLLKILSDYRTNIREKAKAKADYSEFFDLSDKIREQLKVCGYILEDKGLVSSIRKEV